MKAEENNPYYGGGYPAGASLNAPGNYTMHGLYIRGYDFFLKKKNMIYFDLLL